MKKPFQKISTGALGFFICILSLQAVYAFTANRTPSSVLSRDLPKYPGATWILRSDGGKSCSTDPVLSLAEGATDLKDAHIPILESRKGGDTKMRAQVCGIAKGTSNLYLIPKSHLADALALGYQLAP